MAEQVSELSVLFADVSGSTKLYETAGDAVAHAAIEKCVSIMRDKTVNAKGRVIKTIGDEVMSAFATADQAADAAIEMQSAISELPPVGNTQIGIRVGFNHGPVVEREGDVFGDAVNLAARLAGVATKGQIITARDTVMLMSPMLKAATRAITTVQVKGKAQGIQVYELIWQQSEDMTTLASQKSVYKPIERRLDKFILTDHSANGTFVTIEGDKEIVLRREEFTLRGHGWIAFGQSRAAASDVVEFFCE